MACAVQLADRLVELRPYGLPALDPEGLHEKIGVAIHVPSSNSCLLAADPSITRRVKSPTAAA